MASSLLNGLISFWNLTDDLVDPVNEVTLAANGVVSTVGASPPYAFSACRSFSGTSYLEDDTDAGSSSFYQHPNTTGWTISAWVNLGSMATSQFIIGKTDEYALVFVNQGFPRFRFQFGTGVTRVANYYNGPTAGTNADITAPELGIVAGKWFHLVGRFYPLNAQGVGCISITPNGKMPIKGPVQVAANAPFGNYASFSTVAANTNRFTVGALSLGVTPVSAGTKICGVGIWGRAITDGEVGDLYNSGPSAYPNDGEFQGAVYPFA